MVVLAIVLIVTLSAVEIGCLVIIMVRTKNYIQERSEQKAAARRAATRPRAYRQVRKEWAIYRNRQELSNYLKR